MRPLREHLDDPDVTLRAGAALLAKVPPFELSAVQRRRIRARIDAVAAAEPRGLRWLRPAFALPVLLVVGVAGASIGQNWFKQDNTQRALELELAQSQKAAPAKAPAPLKVAPAPTPPAEADSAPTIDPEDLSLDTPVPMRAPKANQSGPGAALLMEALQARRAGDTARAQELTAEYQKKYPSGALKEEAFAISFESAAARKDPNAKRLAQKYLAAFPQGRFRKQAEQVVSNQ